MIFISALLSSHFKQILNTTFFLFILATCSLGRSQTTVTVLPPAAFNSVYVYNPANGGTRAFSFLANGVLIAGCGGVNTPQVPAASNCIPPGLATGVQVYTQQASDANLQTFANQLQPKLDTQISTGISAAQLQIESDLKAQLDKLPASLLTQAAKDDLKAQILAELKPQLDALQKQINALTPAAVKPAPSPATLNRRNPSRVVQGKKRISTASKEAQGSHKIQGRHA
jgi:hypothetical protein